MITWSRFAETKFQPVLLEHISPYNYKGDKISSRQSETVFHLLHFLHFLLIFYCEHVFNYFFIVLKRAEEITGGNFIPAKQDPGIAKEIPLCRDETFHI